VPSRRGLERYIKKKAKAPLETYVPAVLQARGQMLKAGEVMGASTVRYRSTVEPTWQARHVPSYTSCECVQTRV
jgi:hypothetical protein